MSWFFSLLSLGEGLGMRGVLAKKSFWESLCELGVSVVKLLRKTPTTETPRSHRDAKKDFYYCSIFQQPATSGERPILFSFLSR